MQGKGIIKFFLILLTAVCLLQYLYLLPTSKVENAAERYAAAASANETDEAAKLTAEKIARSNYLDSMSSEPILRIPLLGSFTYEKLKQQQIALGLDLKGGISTVLQVNLRKFLETLSNDSKDPKFKLALDNAELAMKSGQTDFVTQFGTEWAKISEGQKLAPIFSRDASLREEINFETPDEDVLGILRRKANETVDLTFKRLKERIDKLGVVQPNISLDKQRDLILVELPGIENFARARSFLENTAKLEFWEVYRVTDPGIYDAFAKADDRLEKIFQGDTSFMQQDTTVAMMMDTVWTPRFDSLGNITDSTYTVQEVPASNDPSVVQGPLLSQLELHNYDGQRSPAVIGLANRNRINTIDTMLNHPQVRSLFPQDLKFMWSAKPYSDNEGIETDQYELYAIRKKRGTEDAPLGGDRIVTAVSNPDPVTNQVAVSLRMDNRGSEIWADMTARAAKDNNREIAIALDDEVVTAPSVKGPIPTGNSEISGSFTIQEGQDLANILQIGKLPARVSIIQESIVGPSLGKENINKSMVAMGVAMLLVMLFMILYYGGSGVVAIIALLANLFFIFGALSSLGTVLTLPGIAGVVLTIGMAVDANVIIYERVREELRLGKSLRNAIAEGFSNSYSAIIDANVTTILTGLVLAYFGLGPIKGFAVVLIIGIITSLFTAVLIGRLIIDWWVDKGNTISFWTEPTKNQFSRFNVDWLGKRKIAYIASSIFIIIGLISIFTRGFELGVDFKGGYSYNVEFDKEINVEAFRQELTKTFGLPPIVKNVDAANTYNITTSYLIDDNSTEAQTAVSTKLYEAVTAVTDENLSKESFMEPDFSGTHITSSAKVGPTVADDIKKSSFYAGIFALVLIFVYILLRFTKWQYSLGAILAVFHDALVVLCAFSLFKGLLPFSMEVDQTFIAALLTIIGFSINDTIVIFDRIRENFNLYTGKTKHEILNMSINSTMSRTIITSLTVLFVVLALLFFGGDSIKGFAFALVIGLISGTYSTIFIAAPVLADLTGEIKPTSIATHSFKRTAKVK